MKSPNQASHIMEDKQRTPPPSVVVGSFAPAKSILPTGPVKVPAGNTGQWFVSAQQLQPTLTWKQWWEQLIHTTNGKFKLLLVGTIFAMLILGPMLEEMSHDYEYFEAYLDNPNKDFVENYQRHGLHLEDAYVAQFYQHIPKHFQNNDNGVIEVYYAENGYTEWCQYHTPYTEGINFETWMSFNCAHGYTYDETSWNVYVENEKLVYFYVDYYNSTVWVASQHYDVDRMWIEFEADNDNEGLEMVAEFLPCLGCMLIPIAVIGIFATRKNESVAQLIH